MTPPIILTTFGTSSTAQDTYDKIESEVVGQFPGQPVHWAYTSRILIKKKREKGKGTLYHPTELVQELRNEGHQRIIIQSLHLFAGSEFQQLCNELRREDDLCLIGKPAFTDPEDFLALLSILRPVITTQPDSAILVVGHGTFHPIWVIYEALEHMLQRCFGSRLFVGTVEGFPEKTGLVRTIKENGFTKVYMIPLFLVAGLHYKRDMMGTGPDSWKTRLEKAGLEVDCLKQGIGQLPGFGELICSHIRQAMDCRQ